MELIERLREKEARIGELEEALSLKGNLVCKDSAYFLTNEQGEIEDGPFCTKCFDIEHVKCRIVPVDRADNPEVRCQKCRLTFQSFSAMKYLLKKQRNEYEQS